MTKINYDCGHSFKKGFCKICEFNDKPCCYEDNILECDIARDEYNAEENEVKQNDID
jgi:hypothetical protein